MIQGHPRAGVPLVRLTVVPDAYVDPARGEPARPRFVDEAGHRRSRLFGQGAELRVVSPSSRRPCAVEPFAE